MANLWLRPCSGAPVRCQSRAKTIPTQLTWVSVKKCSNRVMRQTCHAVLSNGHCVLAEPGSFWISVAESRTDWVGISQWTRAGPNRCVGSKACEMSTNRSDRQPPSRRSWRSKGVPRQMVPNSARRHAKLELDVTQRDRRKLLSEARKPWLFGFSTRAKARPKPWPEMAFSLAWQSPKPGPGQKAMAFTGSECRIEGPNGPIKVTV
ncbi:hypothetical protein C8R45DRAFT_935454 [Mycena sanguinolenta]|nr:hypothetical protein C8R45DRAFT_935454 [Mycena sanguinolenta]